MGVLAVIPARGGSKGLPRKNVLPLCGKPLIAWTIEAALQAHRVDRVVVSTDDAEIASISRRHGAIVVQRPLELSGDDSPSEAAVLHALRESDEGKWKVVVLLQCTSPLMSPDDIDGTVDQLAQADSAFTAIPWNRFVWENRSDEVIPMGHSKSFRPMRQQLQRAQLLEVGAVYAMKVDGFMRTGHRFFGRTVHYPVAPELAIEIDDETDFALVECLLRRKMNADKTALLPNPLQALVVDFDGVLTNNTVGIDEVGKESVWCHRGDGWAIGRLKQMGTRVVILTNEKNPVVQHRAAKLNVECLSVQGDKLPSLIDWLRQNRLDPAATVYIGNDEPDVPCLSYVGCGVVPKDAYPGAVRAAQITLDSRGGQGCVRELTELILHRRGGWL